MKKIQLYSLIAFSLFFWGCSKHQYVFVEGVQNHNTPDNYIIEDDTLEIHYNFSGYNLPVNIRIKNKSEKPVYIDWKKSVAVIDGRKYDYWSDFAYIDLVGFNHIIFSAEGTIVKDERVTYVPPKSFVETTRIFLQTALFKNLPETNSQRYQVNTENGPVRIKKYLFSEEDSPLTFRSIIAVSSTESFIEEVFFENTFWVSEITESPKRLMRQPVNNAAGTKQLNNTSVISTTTGFGKAAGTVAIIGALSGLLYIAADNAAE